MKVGRNDPCHCGSGLKYKKCHLLKDEAAHAAELAALRAAQVEPVADDAPADDAAEAAPATTAGRPPTPVRSTTSNLNARSKPQGSRPPNPARRRAV